MRTLSVEAALDRVRNYLVNDVSTPFFVVVDDHTDYTHIVNDFEMLVRICTSDYCISDDAWPDIDVLFDKLASVTDNVLLLGFGENVSLYGNENTIAKLKDFTPASQAKIVVVCRSIRAIVNSLCEDDRKFDGRRVCFLKPGVSYEIIKFGEELGVPAKDGFKTLLSDLEKGTAGILHVKTSLTLRNIREMDSAYEAIRLNEPQFMVPQECLPDNLWAEFLADKELGEYDHLHWRSFLKWKHEAAPNVYLQYVIDTSPNFDIFKKRFFCALLDIDTNDKRFRACYAERKKLLKHIKDDEIAGYVAETQIKDSVDRICYLTDNTIIERQAIIESLDGLDVLPDTLKTVYPALNEYLHDFSFTGEKAEQFTNYFTEYKRLKLTNRITPEFHEIVRKLAIDGNRPYHYLKTRGEVLDRIEKNNATLFWIDSLGVEYLGYIQNLAKTLGLKITVHTVRANLPTITSHNNDFYETWTGNKTSAKKLDDVKHVGEKDYNYQSVKAPIYVAEELRIIDEALGWTKTQLCGKKTDKVIIVSDHGASRLAVINEQECKWEMASKGKHSGRCCPCSEADVKSEYATEENGYWVLANYDRFKGGRKASVEVHGGATLEEVVIPIIEMELSDNKVSVSIVAPVVTASYKRQAEIVLFSASDLRNMSVRVLEKQYDAELVGNNKHKVIFDEHIRKAGKYTADVFAGDNLVAQVEFEVRSESGKTNDEDWFVTGR